MSVGTKFRNFTVVAALAVAAFGIWLNDPSKWARPEHTAAVTVLWLPSPADKDNRIHVVVRVGGEVVHDKLEWVAPFHRAWPIKGGQRVEVTATLKGVKIASTLGCTATIDGVPDHDPVAIEGPIPGSFVTCWAIA